MIAPARIAAYQTVLDVAAERADLPAALARSRSQLADERDRALAGEIAAGTLRWQAALDHVIAAFAGRAPGRLDPEILAILRIGVFQLLHLDRVPASAVVDDAVDLAKRAGKRSATGLVNALLRRVSRERARLPLPPAPNDASAREAALAYLSITLSHPEWLAERWLDRYGLRATWTWAEFDNQPAPLTLRANTLRTSRKALAEALAQQDVGTEPARFAPDALVVTSGNPLLTRLVHEGQFFVQDEASQLVGLFVDAKPGERILDVCASPGGKTTQMAAAMRDEGFLVAADVRGKRIALLQRTVAEAGARSVRIVQSSARAAAPFTAAFDAVLVDAPCSGLGTIRRDPDIRWRRTPDELAGLAAAQTTMLTEAATAVQSGGRLVYSTCSSEPEENEEVVAAFLAAHPEFRAAAPATFESGPRSELLDASGAMRTLPFRDGLEAFFAVSLVRR
ncbi:MAG: 16S rRNA (cytosine(967)-C(5))-methyltransferase RsmB [Vicinamibacterales bacterium]